MADLAAIATAAGAGMQAYSSYAQGVNSRDVYRENAHTALAEAAAVRAAGKWQATLKRREGALLIGQQKVDYAKSGVLPVGTPLIVRARTAQNIADDAANITYNSEVRATQKENEARFLRRQGNFAYKSGLWNMGTSLLTGVANTYQAGRNAGWFSGGGQKPSVSGMYSGNPSSLGEFA